MLEAVESWTRDPMRFILVVVKILAAIARFVPLAPPQSLPLIAWGALPSVALTIVLSVEVWREPFDLSTRSGLDRAPLPGGLQQAPRFPR